MWPLNDRPYNKGQAQLQNILLLILLCLSLSLSSHPAFGSTDMQLFLTQVSSLTLSQNLF